MSYDLTVYGGRVLGTEQLAQLIEAFPDLEVEDQWDDEVRVLRDDEYSFTVFGPDDVESDELTEAARSSGAARTARWQVIVEGSDPDEFAPARHFAIALAERVGGLAYDEQTGALIGAAG